MNEKQSHFNSHLAAGCPETLIYRRERLHHEYYKERPGLLIEVLPDSTEAADRREKSHAYQAIPA